MVRLLAWLLGCRHAHRGYAFRARTKAHAAEGLKIGFDYQRCMDCGAARVADVQLEVDPRFRPPEPSRARVAEYVPTALERRAWERELKNAVEQERRTR